MLTAVAPSRYSKLLGHERITVHGCSGKQLAHEHAFPDGIAV